MAGRTVVALSLCVMFACTTAAQASTDPHPYFVDGGRFFVEPTFRIDLSGTGSWYIGKSHWLSWRPQGATARTTFYSNTCKPTCAAGRYRSQAARVRFFHLAACRGKMVFTAFTLADLNGRRLLAGDFRSIGSLRGC